MKFNVKTKEPERKLVAAVIHGCMYWEKDGKVYGRTGLFGEPLIINNTLESLANSTAGRAIYEGDTLEMEF